MSDYEGDSMFLSEKEYQEQVAKFNDDVKKGMCDFCGLWPPKHHEWCKKKDD